MPDTPAHPLPGDPLLWALARTWLAEAQRVAVLTGAGASAESGVPTFRDALTGWWSRHDPQQLATEQGFRADPALVWSWYQQRREGVARAQPNAGHRALADFAQRHPGRLTLITQNVDGLHQQAGSPGVLALHGELMRNRWLSPHAPACPGAERSADSVARQWGGAADPAVLDSVPRCPDCGVWVRPGVVWFGEPLPEAVLREAEQAAQRCDLMLVVGTAGAVHPAAGLVLLAHSAGARVVVLNPQPTELDPLASLCLHAGAAAGLPALLDGL
ncbi:NAD-dependent deacylase [Curvibacter sp. HBC61]|uniref:NAD-dependent protein deacylase n=1 Tax=Curvibacter cyanobacteriorum TaxID=3026422 RepID=A0ABT5MTX9_9BURK|nr:NAD-dependent deacylase [Curvibacter sp. HBC61]MDD0837268.1 NAD-dependent deacylase [Curvibacter sp. HBC61]